METRGWGVYWRVVATHHLIVSPISVPKTPLQYEGLLGGLSQLLNMKTDRIAIRPGKGKGKSREKT